MSLKNKNQLQEYFRTGKKPTQQQFWDWMDSFYHKNEDFPGSRKIHYGTDLQQAPDFPDLFDYLVITNDGSKEGQIRTIYQWNGTRWIAINLSDEFVGTTEEKDFYIKSNDTIRAQFIKNGTIYFGDEGIWDDGTIIAGFHSNKPHPIYTFSGVTTDGTTTSLQIGIATRNNFPHKLAKKGDISIIRAGEGKNLIIGTRTLTENIDEEMSIILAPNNRTTDYPLVVRSRTAKKSEVGIGVENPSDKLELNSEIANDSGLTFTQLKSTTPATPKAKALGVTATGKVVTVDMASLLNAHESTRPVVTAKDEGQIIYDKNLKKVILWNGNSWTNLDGSTL